MPNFREGEEYKTIIPRRWIFIAATFELTRDYTKTDIPMLGKFYKEYCRKRDAGELNNTRDKIEISENGSLIIRKGYQWNFSGPMIFIDSKPTREAGLVHDALYELSDDYVFIGYNSKEMRKKYDDLFHDMLVANGMSKSGALICWTATRCFGGKKWGRWESGN